MKSQKCFAVIVFISLILLTSCTKEVKNNWDDFTKDFVESYFKQNPDWAVYREDTNMMVRLQIIVINVSKKE